MSALTADIGFAGMRQLFLTLVMLVLLTAVNGCGTPLSIKLYEERHSNILKKKTFAALPRDNFYKVKNGDTLYLVAQRFGVSSRALIQANKLSAPFRLQTGQLLKLPVPRSHKVLKGDTLFAISRKYGVSMSGLAQLNGLNPPYKIISGSLLRLPGTLVAVSRKQTLAKNDNTPSKALGKSVARSQIKTNIKNRSTKVKLPANTGGFVWPLQGRVISRFGSKGKGLHNDGVNLAAPRGTPVLASQSGIVAYAGNQLRGFGNLVLIKHINGVMTAYAHNEKLLVSPGEQVRRGQQIAKVGSTGSVASPQLHFEVRSGRQPIDPIKFLTRKISS